MIKFKRIVAIMVVITMVMSNVALPLSNIAIAAQQDVTVVITADADSSIVLEDDNETLTYTCGDNSKYSFNLKNGDENVKIIKHTDEADGRFYDSYIASNIDSNENLRIVCPNIDLGKLGVRYAGEFIGMWEDDVKNYWATDKFEEIDDVNHYQFRIEGKFNVPGPGPSQDIDWENEVYTVDFGTATWEVKGRTVTATVEGKDLTKGPVELKGSEVIKLTGYDERFMEPALELVGDDYSERLRVNENSETWVINRNADNFPNDIPFNFVVRRRTGSDEIEDDWHERENPNTTATVNLSSDEEYKDTYQDAIIEINGYPINTDVEYGGKLPATNTAHYYYDPNENNGKVKLTFSTLFIGKYVGNIQINDKVYNVTKDLLDYSNRTDWLNHYGHQVVTLEVDVDKEDVYNIKVNVTENEGKDQWIGNFLWTDDDRESQSDEYIGNSLLEVVKIVYEIDGKEVTVEGDELFKDRYIEYNPYGEFGSLAAPEGAKCTMRITPDYGYQVTAFGINGSDIETGDAISEFTFPIYKGNFHLGAKVTAVSNEVDAKSEKVKSGDIEIGKNEIDSGTVVLTVSDIKPDEGKVAKFEEAAGDYTISSYLDIDLDKVVYKGSKDDVWSERIHELENEATISLKLEEGVDGNNIIIIHNINDGEEYEIIEIESYDPETNIITFKTKSFSNYAIAIKKDNDVVPDEEDTDEKEKYTIEKGDFSVVFSDDAGHDFDLSIQELWNLSDDELAELDITKEEYAKAKEELVDKLDKYGRILNVYDITISDNTYDHSNELTLKIKIKDDMKKYNTFKLVCIDNEVIKANDVVDLKIEGDYLVGNLYHLSNYALVASNVEKTNKTTTSKNASNPSTGDMILSSMLLFAAATFGLVITLKVRKNRKMRRN